MVPKTMDVRAVPKGVVLQVRNVLVNLVDVAGKPTVALVELLLGKVIDPDERSRLEQIMGIVQNPEGPDAPLRASIDGGGYDVLQLLDEFPSCSLNIFEFLQVAQPLKPRYYSTSSSPRVHGSDVHITVGLERVPVPGMDERVFEGLSAHYLHRLREGDRLNVFLDSANAFHLQDELAKPMIFVSAGTGFAPMRAFLWERLALKEQGVCLGEAALFNGVRSRNSDFIYRQEVEWLTAEGALDHVHVAASRDDPGHRTYVQELLCDQGALIWRLLDAGGYVYVCGSQAMRDGVRRAFIDVVAEQASLSDEHAEAYVDEMERQKRYRPDLWG